MSKKKCTSTRSEVSNSSRHSPQSSHESQRPTNLAKRCAGVLLLFDNVATIERTQLISTYFRKIRLVAVSKLKPATDILALHQPPTSHFHFGENYAQELQQKASLLPKTIRWHFIGALQTNKCKPLAEGVPNLWCVSSVDSAKKADALEKGRAASRGQLKMDGNNRQDEGVSENLRVQVQVNTSGEAEKSGVHPKEAAALCKHIRDHCPHLQVTGLMTIGAIARSQATTAETENEDFIALRETRHTVAKELGIAEDELELGMGMSSDFEGAIAQGSGEVRVGTTIFGERPAKKDAEVKEDIKDGKT